MKKSKFQENDATLFIMQFYQFANYRIFCFETQVSYCQAQLPTQTQPQLGAEICFILN